MTALRTTHSFSFPFGITKAATVSLDLVKKNAYINAFTSLVPDEKVLSAAVAAEKRESAHKPMKSVFDGRLVAIKDNIVTTDLPTTCGSEMLRDYVSPFDATVVEQLREAGCIIMGKTNMDEFGMGSHSLHSAFGAVERPRFPGRETLSAGGSSGGSAAAVAAGMCHFALGTDTGGSVRLPASYCGIVGFKPSYGLLSRWGVIAYANSLDTVGIMTRRVWDAKEIFELLNHHDPKDPTSVSLRTRELTSETHHRNRRAISKRPLRIGVPAEYNISQISPTVRAAWEKTLQHLEAQGAEIVDISLPHTRAALSAYYILAPAEASSNLARYDGLRYGYRSRKDRSHPTKGSILFGPTRKEAFGSEVRRRIIVGTYTLSSEAIGNYFLQAQRVRRLVQQDFENVFALPNPLLDRAKEVRVDGVDAVVVPAALTRPPTLKTAKAMSNVETYANDVLTVPASLAGVPSVSVPVVVDEDGATTGMQVIAQWGDEETVWQVAQMVEDMEGDEFKRDVGIREAKSVKR